MKIKDLIEKLNKYDLELDVCVDGYEGGITELKKENIGLIGINRQFYKEWFYGEHEENEDSNDKVLVLRR